MSKVIYAYSDESGNTGSNVFDSNQPVFWTGTLLTEKDLSDSWGSFILNCKEKNLFENELHANELGYFGIEKRAQYIQNFIEEIDCQFIFSRVEKLQVAKMKFVDTILDSGLNQAVSHLHYNIRFLRFGLGYEISQKLSPQGLENFWSAFAKRDLELFRNVVGRVRWNVLNKTSDKRLKELLIDALDWALKYPEVLLDRRRDEMDSPNIVAFTLIIQSLHRIYGETNMKIGKFYHDEQNEFAKSMLKSYTLLREAAFSAGGAFSITDVKMLDTYQCQLEICPSTLPGLQLIDVALWLTKRAHEKEWQGYDNCRSLLNAIRLRSTTMEWSKEAYKSELEGMMIEINSKTLTYDDLIRGKEMLQDNEKRRKNRMQENINISM